jgi:hypothetical protein
LKFIALEHPPEENVCRLQKRNLHFRGLFRSICVMTKDRLCEFWGILYMLDLSSFVCYLNTINLLKPSGNFTYHQV